jgi:hypothetical protein
MNRLVLGVLLSVLISNVSAQAPQGDESEQAQAPTAAQMQAHMQMMREQMRQLHATTDSQERRRLMQAHMQSMRQGMGMMGSMQRDGMGQGGMMRNCPAADTQCRMQGMEQQQHMMSERMGMMQMMLDHMMQQMEEQQRESNGDADE